MNTHHNETKDENIIARKSYHLLLALTIAGVLPFFFSAIILHTHLFTQPIVLAILLSYAAVILSFLGGIQWGIGVIRLEEKTNIFPHLFTLSILPSLAAWLLLLPNYPKMQMIGFILSFAIVAAVDTVLTIKNITPRWFLRLRLVITFLVIATLLFCLLQ